MTVLDAINLAERALRIVPKPRRGLDPRWQAIINVGEFIESNPEQVWQFIKKWGVSKDEDLRMAIATCLLEHLLEHHFSVYFPLTKALVQKDRCFNKTFALCCKYGQSKERTNAALFDKLKKSANDKAV